MTRLSLIAAMAGLTALMALSGLPVAVREGSRLPFWSGVHVFMGDEQSLEDNLSTFTAQISHLSRAWGGLDSNALKAANVTVMLLRSDGRLTTLPGEKVSLNPGSEELSVARRQQGSSARTGIASNGEPYRIVAVPFQSTTEKFALVLGRPLEATNNIMGTLAWSLVLFGVLGAAVSSFLAFSVGALLPVLPYLFGASSLLPALVVSVVALFVVGVLVSRVTVRSWWYSGLRQLTLGGVAAAATFGFGSLVGGGLG